MRKLFRTMGGFLLTLALLLYMSMTAFAYTRIDVDAKTSLTLKYVSGSGAMSGADFRLYKAAEISETNQYTLTEDFVNYSVSLEGLDNAGWLNLAATLAAYATRDGLTLAAEGATGTDGTLTFDSLTVGLYLVTGNPMTIGNDTYTPMPFLVSLPNLNSDMDTWEYDVTAEVKYEKVENGEDIPTPETTERGVKKVWKNDEGVKRPESVTVQLLKDETVYSEVTLSKENNWRYTWTDLSLNSNWQLTKKMCRTAIP